MYYDDGIELFRESTFVGPGRVREIDTAIDWGLSWLCARRLGLKPKGTTEWTGLVDGCVVSLRLSGGAWLVEATAPGPSIPLDVDIESKHPDSDARWLANCVRPMIGELRAEGWHARLQAGRAVVRALPDHPTGSRDALVDHASRLALLVGAVVQAMVERVSRRVGCQSLTPGQLHKGELDGLEVLVLGEEASQGVQGTLTLSLALREPLADGTLLRRTRDREKPSPWIRDLILGQVLMGSTDDPLALNQLLCQDDVRKLMIEVLVEHPRSHLTSREIVHVVDGWPFALEPAVERVLALVDALHSAPV